MMAETVIRAVGRPSDYYPEVIDETIKYFQEYESQGDVVPTIAGLAIYLGTNRVKLWRWTEKNEEFRNVLETLKTFQEKSLLSGGLKGDYNSVITKLMLTKHGYSDKQEVSGPDGGAIPIADVSATETARRVAFILNKGLIEGKE